MLEHSTSETSGVADPENQDKYYWILSRKHSNLCLHNQFPEQLSRSKDSPVLVREQAVDDAQLWRFDGVRFIAKRTQWKSNVALVHGDDYQERERPEILTALADPVDQYDQTWKFGPGGTLTNKSGRLALNMAAPPGGVPSLSMVVRKDPPDQDQVWVLQEYVPDLDVSVDLLQQFADGNAFTIGSRAYRGWVMGAENGQKVKMVPSTTKPVDSILWTYKDGGIFNKHYDHALVNAVSAPFVCWAQWIAHDMQRWWLTEEGFLVCRGDKQVVSLRPGTLEAGKNPDVGPYSPLRRPAQSWHLKWFEA